MSNIIVLCVMLVVTSLTNDNQVAGVIFKTNTSSGELIGNTFTLVEGQEYQAWTDVPYAHPPVGDRRFKPPDVYTWDTPRNVSAKKPERCLQYNFISIESNRVEGTEEACLMLSIYRYIKIYLDNEFEFKSTGHYKLYPVIVLLHPGTYMYDFSFDGRKFAANLCCEYVIPVVVNYRLGPLGFLGTGVDRDEGIKANLGMLDQVAALKWIQRNIAAFFGDPQRVTLVGVAGGASSVHLHTMSRWSKGLFHQAMSFGGSAMVPWAVAKRIGEKTIQFGRNMLGCHEGDYEEEMFECMRREDLNRLKHSLDQLNLPLFYDFQNTPLSPLGPTVDHDFLDDDPAILLRAGEVNRMPYVFSFTDSAGLLPTAHYHEKPTTYHKIDTEWASIAPALLDYKDTMDKRLHETFANRTLWFYFKLPHDVTITDPYAPTLTNDFPLMVKMLTDRLYTTGIVEAARLQGLAETDVPVFLYRFTYQATVGFSYELLRNDLLFGPAVGDDFLTFIAGQYNNLKDVKDISLQDVMKRFFISFASSGKLVLPSAWANGTDGQNMVDTKHYYTSNDKDLKKARVSRIVTYNHILNPEKFRIRDSNNIGNGKYWRRAPLLAPNVADLGKI